MSSLLFNPWEGRNYENSKFGRLLIIGESHYLYKEELDLAGYTKRIVEGLGASEDNNFFIKIGKVFHPEDHTAIWPDVAFANAIQFPFTERRNKYTIAQMGTVEPAVQEYLELTRPNKMIVFSYTVWNQGFPGNLEWIKYVDTLNDEIHGKMGKVFRFDYSNGACYGLGVQHPSSSKPPFKPAEWRPLINLFLEKKYSS